MATYSTIGELAQNEQTLSKEQKQKLLSIDPTLDEETLGRIGTWANVTRQNISFDNPAILSAYKSSGLSSDTKYESFLSEAVPTFTPASKTSKRVSQTSNPKTELVNGQRVNIETGQVVESPSSYSTALAYLKSKGLSTDRTDEQLAALESTLSNSTSSTTVKSSTTPVNYSVTSSQPSTASIVDYLKSQGQSSSYSSRKALYEDLGLSRTLGSYKGSATQNLTLLQRLQGQNAPSASQTLNTAQGGTQGLSAEDQAFVQQAINQGLTVENAAQYGLQGQRDVTTQESTGGYSASTLYPDIFSGGVTESDKSEADLVNEWLNSSEGQSFLDRLNLSNSTAEATAQALKQQLEKKYEADKETLENSLAANGLAFSGVRNTQVKALADSLASSVLEVDRDMATKLLESDLDLRDAILKGVAEIAKAADDGRKEAIDQLNKAGYAVVNGQLVPTQSALNQQANLAISQARLQLAQEANALAKQKFLFDVGKSQQADNDWEYIRQLIELNPGANSEEIKLAAMQNTKLSATEINTAVNALQIASPQEMEAIAKGLVSSSFRSAYRYQSGELEKAKQTAKDTIEKAGGTIKVKIGNKTETINLTSTNLNYLYQLIDSIQQDEVSNVGVF